jgi:hypothetical protein
MDGSGKTKYKRIGKQLGIPWTQVRDMDLAGLTLAEKADSDPLGMAHHGKQARKAQRRGKF